MVGKIHKNAHIYLKLALVRKKSVFASKLAIFARKVKENGVESPKLTLLPQWLSYQLF